MRPYIFLFLLNLLLAALTQSTLAAPIKRALIIGIGAYKSGNGWNTLHGDDDADLMNASLETTGFLSNNIIVLKNEQANKKGIVQAMNTLLNECGQGDKIVFHFSGHGQQIQDMNGDEADGLDEALISYDAPASNISDTYNGSLHLTDDELGVWFEKVKIKIGSSGQLIVFLDACHSGTASRGTSVVRGDKPPLILSPSTFKSKSKEKNQNESGYNQTETARGTGTAGGKFILLSAAQADQSDYEYENRIGSLTYAINNVLTNKIRTTSLSFRDFYEYVRNEMALIVPYQNPELEGDKDVTIFDGDMVVQEPYFYVNKVRGKEITISGGAVLNIDKDAVIGFYKAGTRSRKDATPLASGTVIKVSPFESVVLLNAAYDVDSIRQCRAMVMKEGSKDRRTSVLISGHLPALYKQKLTDTLASVKQVLLVNAASEADLIIADTLENISGNIRILSARESRDLVNSFDGAQGADIYDCEGNARHADGLAYIVTTIKNYSVNTILKTADFAAGSFNLKMELLPAELDAGNRIVKVFPDTNNVPAVHEASTAALHITNTGATDGYIAVIEFNPNGSICPSIGINDNIKLEAGKSHDFPVTGFSPPYGRYVLKGFITANAIGNEINLVISQQGSVRGLGGTGITGMLGDMLDNPTRARTAQTGEIQGSSTTYSYQLVNQ